MPFKKGDSACCDRCGIVFSSEQYDNPRQKLWNHQRNTIPCDQKRKRKELDEWKRTVTADDLAEFKRLKEQEGLLHEMRSMKQEIQSLREEVKQKATLQMTIVNLSVPILVARPMLRPIQELETVDLREARFGAVHALTYALPERDLSYAANVPTFLEKMRLFQSIVPVSMSDESGRGFYLDRDVLTLDSDGTVCMRLLQTFARSDPEVQATRLRLADERPETREERVRLRASLSGVHLSTSDRALCGPREQ